MSNFNCRTARHWWTGFMNSASGFSLMTVIFGLGSGTVIMMALFAGLNAVYKGQSLARDKNEAMDFQSKLKRVLGLSEICQANLQGYPLTAGATVSLTALNDLSASPIVTVGMPVEGSQDRIKVNSIQLKNFQPISTSGPNAHRGFADLEIGYAGSSGSASTTTRIRLFVSTNDGVAVPADLNKIQSCSSLGGAALPVCQDGDVIVYQGGSPACGRDSGARVTTFREKVMYPCHPLVLPVDTATLPNPMGNHCATVDAWASELASTTPFTIASGKHLFETTYMARSKATLRINAYTPVRFFGGHQEWAFLLAAFVTVNAGAPQFLGTQVIGNPACMDLECNGSSGATAHSIFDVDVNGGDSVDVTLRVVSFQNTIGTLTNDGSATRTHFGAIKVQDHDVEGYVEFEEITRP